MRDAVVSFHEAKDDKNITIIYFLNIDPWSEISKLIDFSVFGHEHKLL